MKTRTIIIKLFSSSLLLSLLFFNVSSLRCETKPASIKAQSQAGYVERKGDENKSDPEWQDDKSRRYKELEWLIVQNLIKQYQKLEEINPEDEVD
jgi:hypothetical protein